MFFRATCVDNFDPLGRGRIRFRYKHDKSVPNSKLPYAEYCSPFGGGDNRGGAGFFFIPEIGSQVWILEEEGDSGNPVWIGSSFYSEQGRQNIPIEAKPTSVEPAIRIIKTPTGNKLILDDRESLPTGGSPIPIQLISNTGAGLKIQEGFGKGTGIDLAFGTSGAGLRMRRGGLNLKSNLGAGLYVSEQTGMVKLRDSTKTAYIGIMGKKLLGYGASGMRLSTDLKADILAGGRLQIKGEPIKILSTGKISMIASSDIGITAGETLNINAPEYRLTGRQGTSFVLDFIVPGIPGTDDGQVIFQTNLGAGIMMRNGPPNPKALATPTPWFDANAFTNNDATAGLTAGRMGIGDSVSGNAVLEGRFGGIFISGTPVPGVGTVLLGRVPLPFTPITPMAATAVTQAPLSPSAPPVPIVIPGQPQPAVLGGNLYFALSKLTWNLINVMGTMIQNAPLFANSPVGPAILSPVVVQQLAVAQTELIALATTSFGPSPLPTNILSATTFID